MMQEEKTLMSYGWIRMLKQAAIASKELMELQTGQKPRDSRS